MNNTSQPFTEHVTKANGSQTVKMGWIAAVSLALLVTVSVLLWSTTESNRHKIESLRSELGQATEDLSKAIAENQTNLEQVISLKSELAELKKERERVTQKAKGLEDEMRADLESKDVTISKLQGKLTVNILDRIMFDSGEAVLKPDGEAVMEKIATLLKDHPEIKIHVIGHTDNIPIRREAHSRFASNWELSTARALAALHFLTEKAGVDPRRVGAVGYGEYRPLTDNTTAEGRAKNRRIAITILPDELASADAPTAAKADLPPNTVPIPTEPESR